jgi:uncharacterized membrane protein (UPF0136 family)
MSLTTIAAIVYGLLAIVGGILGYAQAKSKISLMAGCGCGLLLLISAVAQLQNQAWGVPLAILTTVVLLVAFVMRWLKTRRFMPAGLMLLLGIPALAIMIQQTLAIAVP